MVKIHNIGWKSWVLLGIGTILANVAAGIAFKSLEYPNNWIFVTVLVLLIIVAYLSGKLEK